MPAVVLIMEFKSDRLECGIYAALGAKSLGRISTPYGGDASATVASIAAQLKNMGHLTVADAAVSLPPGAISQRVLDIPFDDKKKLDEIVGFEAGESFIKDTEDFILQAMPLADGKALAVAAEKEALRSVLSAMKASGLDPSWAGGALFSRHKLLDGRVGSGETAAFVDATSITIVKGGRPRFFKEIGGQDDLTLAMLALKADAITPDVVYSTKGAASLAAAAGAQVHVLDGVAEGDAGMDAMAAHYFSGIRDAVNFRIGEFAHTAGAARARRGLKAAVALCVLLIAIWGGNSYLRTRSYDESRTRIRAAIDAAYRDLFKGDTKVVDPVYQIEVKLKEMRDERKMLSGGINALEMMRELAQIESKGAKIRLLQVSFRAGGVSAKGEAPGINGANEFKADVSRLPYFKDIVLTDVKSSASGGVVFNIDMAVKDAM